MSEINVTVTLKTYTCSCGGAYAVPNWLNPYDFTCPMCANRNLHHLREKNDQAREQINHLERVIRGYKSMRRV